ncbi:MAG: hydroxymethylbilane synthase [Bradyrhizobium sp.]|nr:MAG: hydroxymethylbilane synthase [Bradyrhizobium sp.]
MVSPVLFTLGTRGSPLALAQAREARRRLVFAHGWSEEQVAIEVIRTTGDMIQDRPLAEAGGKGLFTKEIDSALLEGRIDFAIHSAKDLPTALPDGVTLAGFLPREDARDALICNVADSFATLPHGARLGAASLRRQAQARRLRPDLRLQLLRGNVETRLRKVESGEIEATLLALAGLKRLGLADRARALLDIDDFLPAVGQGAIAIAARRGDARVLAALTPIDDEATHIALIAERAFLAVLDGSCRTPIAGHARLAGGALTLRGQVLREDGSESFEIARSGAPREAERLGAEAGQTLLARLPHGVLAIKGQR